MRLMLGSESAVAFTSNPGLPADDALSTTQRNASRRRAGWPPQGFAHPWRDVVGIVDVELALRARQALCVEGVERHAGAGPRVDRVARNPIPFHLAGDHEAERGNAGLRRRVVRLAGVAEQTRLRSRVDDPAAHRLAGLLEAFPPVGGRPAGRDEVTLQVDPDHVVPLALRHVEDGPVPYEAGVAHQHVEATVGLDRLVDHVLGALPVGHVREVRHCTTTEARDLLGNLARGPGIGARAIPLTTEIVDHDRGALLRHQHRVAATEAPAGAGDDDDLAVQHAHESSDVRPEPEPSLSRTPGPPEGSCSPASPQSHCCSAANESGASIPTHSRSTLTGSRQPRTLRRCAC